eukprot:gene8559-biopygen8548
MLCRSLSLSVANGKMDSVFLTGSTRSSGMCFSLRSSARCLLRVVDAAYARMLSRMVYTSMSSCRSKIASGSILTRMKHSIGVYTSSRCLQISLSVVRSIRALTIFAETSSVSLSRYPLMIGVLIVFDALMISLIRGTPCVMLMDATPAKWNVFRVICVPGSPILCAPMAPQAVPGSHLYFKCLT